MSHKHPHPQTDIEQTVVVDSESTLFDEHNQDTQPNQTTGDNKRFNIKTRLGSGGSGSVFLSWDNQLQRNVAIKMIAGDNLLRQQAVLAEARMQAKIDHPNLCKIYQVEEATNEGEQSYMVMQYIAGQTSTEWLAQHATQLSSRKRIGLMQKICEGIAVMHSFGVIHRDIKPDNIMIEALPDAQLNAYLVDFGLAENDDDNKQRQQNSAGTPSFMSPEQWQGARLDCRSDVYSFGATLYQMLTGIKPPPAKHGAPSLSALDAPHWQSLPNELKAIIAKCMAQKRDERYQNGHELNLELLRYLAGEPVNCITSKKYRAVKWLTKYRWQSSFISVILLGLLGFALWQQIQSAQQQYREQLLTQFTSRFERLDAAVKLANLAPPHEINTERKRWQAQIDALLEEINTLGESAKGPGHYAIGQMYLSLQQFDQALSHLNVAWQNGFKQPRAAYALALSHGAIYQRQKSLLSNIPGTTARAQKLAQLDSQHRQPAIEYLRQGIAGSPYQTYAKALLQFYQEQYDDALQTLTQLEQTPSWFYQHNELMGDIYLAQTEKANYAHENGQVQANAALALEYYDKAIAIGRSDLNLRLKPVSVRIQLLNNSLFGEGKDFDKHYQDALQAVDAAALLEPKNAGALMQKGHLFAKLSEYQEQRSGDPVASRANAIEQFELALEAAPHNTNVRLSLGLSYSQLTRLMLQLGQDPSDEFEKAKAVFAQIPELSRDYGYYSYLALLLHEQANHLAAQNKRDDLAFEQAITTYQKAIAKKPDAIAPYLNMGVVLRDWSYYLPFEQAKTKLTQAIDGYKQAQKLNPNHFVLHYNLAQSYLALSRLNNYLLTPDDTQLALGMKHLLEAEKSQPNHPFIQLEKANLTAEQGVAMWQAGCAFTDHFERAKGILENSLAQHQGNAILLDGRAWIVAKEQQLKHFSYQKPPAKGTSYKLALHQAGEVLSGHLEYQYLIELLGDNHHISQHQIEALSNEDDSLLAQAQWFSRTGQFHKAQSLFDRIKGDSPLLLSLYRLAHLDRWQAHLLAAKAINPAKSVQSLKAEQLEITQFIARHFPQFTQLKAGQTYHKPCLSSGADLSQ